MDPEQPGPVVKGPQSAMLAHHAAPLTATFTSYLAAKTCFSLLSDDLSYGEFAVILPTKPLGLRAFLESSEITFSVTTLELTSQNFSPSITP